MIQLPQLHESLLIANERLVDRARRRARLFRTGLMTSAAVVSIGGAAVAGLAIWNPQLGREGNRPSVSASPVPAEQQAVLGVFRRVQTAVDRGAVSQRALIAFSREYRGVRLDAVRVVYRGTGSAGISLLSVADLRARDLPGTAARRDGLCAYASEGDPTDVLVCFGTDEVQRGKVSYAIGDVLWAVLPDAVSSVTYHGSDGSDHDLPVRSNAITVARDEVDPTRPDVTWRDATGATIVPEGGSPMALEVDPAAAGGGTSARDSTTGFYDCGADDGGVTPTDIPCGPASRRWVPEAGQSVPESAPKAK